MGLSIDREFFSPEDHRRFTNRLAEGLAALDALLSRPGFGLGPGSLGAELELSLIDDTGRPAPVNLPVLGETLDPRLTVELDRFNLECNLDPVALAGEPFTRIGEGMRDAFAEVARAAALHGARPAMVGILPTLQPDDLRRAAMTDTTRFRALARVLAEHRDEPFRLCIDGSDPLDIECEAVTFEGANTSLQIHLRVAPGDFARTFNAAQIATVAAVAACGNSPTFLGHRLWHETRVALFKQAVDQRSSEDRLRGDRARVSFGFDWLRSGAIELFEDAVRHYDPLLPASTDEDARAVLRAGALPQLAEIRLHQGTVWSWNRPVYDPAGEGHLRIEMRALPAGPGFVDMQANTAFLVGATLGLAEESAEWIRDWPFADLHHSFYRAAQDGLAAELRWPATQRAEPRPARAAEVVETLLPIADRGLAAAGVESAERSRWLDIIAERVRSGVTGAVWQRVLFDRLEPALGREAALREMLARYCAHSVEDEPVHRWPLET